MTMDGKRVRRLRLSAPFTRRVKGALSRKRRPCGFTRPELNEGNRMDDAFVVLGLPPDSDDTAIRRRYLELVRQFTPEHHPQKFAQVREAYERLKDLNTRLRYRLFEAGKNESIDSLIEELTCRDRKSVV